MCCFDYTYFTKTCTRRFERLLKAGSDVLEGSCLQQGHTWRTVLQDYCRQVWWLKSLATAKLGSTACILSSTAFLLLFVLKRKCVFFNYLRCAKTTNQSSRILRFVNFNQHKAFFPLKRIIIIKCSQDIWSTRDHSLFQPRRRNQEIKVKEKTKKQKQSMQYGNVKYSIKRAIVFFFFYCTLLNFGVFYSLVANYSNNQ